MEQKEGILQDGHLPGGNEKEQYVCLLVGSFPILLESMLKIRDRYLENQVNNEAIISWENKSRTKQNKINMITIH